jgi:hypothetical protein
MATVIQLDTLGEGVLFNESGQVWDSVSNVWETAPAGPGAYASEHVIVGVQIGGVDLNIFTIPALAESGNWTLALYSGTGALTTDTVDALETKPDHAATSVVGTELIPEFIHYCDGVTSRSIISLNANFAGQLAMAPDLGDATIATVNSAALTGAASVTGTALSTSISKTQAIYTVAALSVAGTYTATVSVTTTDSQTLVSTGTIVVT